MTTTVIKRINPVSVFKITTIIGMFLGFLIAFILLITNLFFYYILKENYRDCPECTSVELSPYADAFDLSPQRSKQQSFEYASLVTYPIVAGLVMGIQGYLVAIVYNAVKETVGGIEIELEEKKKK